jgi:hypothetical protein
MRKYSLPPFSSLQYWWILENRNGDIIETPRKKVTFSDNNHSWKETIAENLHIFWYQGNDSFGKELLDSAVSAKLRLQQDTGSDLPGRVNFYIYANSGDLQKAMVNPREWTGGAAFYEYGIIAIGISQRDTDWGKKAIAHELGHLFTHQLIFSPYGAMVPTWVDEGLAMHAEGNMDRDSYNYLMKMNSQNKLISVRSLASPFSAKTDEALLSYAESQSIIEFLINNYGKDKISKLLKVFQEGADTDTALTEVYNLDQDKLETAWKQYLQTVPPPEQQSRQQQSGLLFTILLTSLIIVIIVIAVVVLIFVFIYHYKKSER